MRIAANNSNDTYTPVDFNKIKVGARALDDAVLSLGESKRVNPRLGEKKEVLKAINNGNLDKMRDISNFFYRVSGIYSRLCRYMARLYKYDWFITPYIAGCQGLIESDAGLGDVDSQAEVKEKKKQFQKNLDNLKTL